MFRRVVLIGVIHLLVVLGCMALSVGSAMHGLDTGAAPATVARIGTGLSDVLLLPVARPMLEHGTTTHWGGGWFYVVLAINSLVWGMILSGLGKLLWTRRAPQPLEGRHL